MDFREFSESESIYRELPVIGFLGSSFWTVAKGCYSSHPPDWGSSLQIEDASWCGVHEKLH
jgi:hypothetical protein